MQGLLSNPVISGLLSGGPNAVRAMSQQQVAQMLPRGRGGMMGAPSPIVQSGGGMAGDIGAGLSALGGMAEKFAGMRKAEARREQIEKMIAQLPAEDQPLARADPEAFFKASIQDRFKEKPQLTTANTALYNDNGLPKRLSLSEGMQSGLPEWQDAPDVKTVGNDAIGYYALSRGADGKWVKELLIPGMGRKTEDKRTAAQIDAAALGYQPGTPEYNDYIRARTLPQPSPQDDLAAARLREMEKDKVSQAINKYEDLGKTIRQAETVLNHPGREAGTGMSSWRTMVPGSDAKGFASQLETLKSQVFLPEVQKMQGMGALSNAEGQKISAAFASLDTDMPEEEFKRSLETAIGDLRRAQERARLKLPGDYKDPFAASGGEGGADALYILIDKYAGEQ